MSDTSQTFSWIDIGANLTNRRFTNDLEAVLKTARIAGVKTIILTGTHIEASHLAIEIAQRFNSQIENDPSNSDSLPTLYSTAGIHPHDANSWTSASFSELKNLLNAPNVVAVGEAGLDFNRNYSTPAAQEAAFEQQLELAAELKKPLFLHQRDAHKRMRSMLHAVRDQLGSVVIHCFTDNKQALFDYLDLDCHIGITGWVCDERRGQDLRSLLPNIPLERLMLETDAPYLLPRDLPNPPKDKRNEPKFLSHIGQVVASLYGISVEELSMLTCKTSSQFFNI